MWPSVRWWCRVEPNKRLDHPQTVRRWELQELCKSHASPARSTAPPRAPWYLTEASVSPHSHRYPLPQLQKHGCAQKLESYHQIPQADSDARNLLATSRILDSHVETDLQPFRLTFRGRLGQGLLLKYFLLCRVRIHAHSSYHGNY